jgi:RNA polymerase sigma factor (sigma-70 family)
MAEQGGNPYLDAPDMALMQAMADGQSAALDALYARFSSAVFGFLMVRLNNRQTAEEVLQDVMLAAWRGAGGFRGESKVLTWLLTIARNRAINVQRRRKLTFVPFNDALDSPLDDTGPLERVVRQNEQRTVRETLRKLPEGQREVLTLVFYHQMTESEVAEVLDIPVGTVKSRLHRGKEALRRLLQQEAV